MDRKSFWQNIMGIAMLMIVTLVAGRMGVLEKGGLQTAEAGGKAQGAKQVVVIDSGHGGNDPGKIGVSGQKEKDINLQIAKKLKSYLEAANVAVVMTRESDIGLYKESDSHKKSADMKKRCQIIDEAEPVLAVSIHQNSYHQEEICGAQVFYYKNSEKGQRLAEILQKRFDYVLGEAENRRKAKGNDSYYLLLNVKAPIVIVECGFLSNTEEAAKLSDEEYQDRIAWTIHLGILQYMNTMENKKTGSVGA
ncbi:MAG: N-acetylmuramoyl-L-alanine amidase [Lachnospiraceae bacterium]|jgi:N-acetylmuramoyl-L-alanine amidase